MQSISETQKIPKEFFRVEKIYSNFLVKFLSRNSFSNNMIEKPTILYSANDRNYKYAQAIAKASSRHKYKLVKEIIFPDANNLLNDVCGVVFVGSQTSTRYATVFLDHTDYFKFLKKARNRMIKVAAVLEPSCRLPNNNEGMDCIIETAKGESLVGSIASSLEKFFETS